MSDSPRAELIKLETDRRLGHEWDEWDGSPLPRNGDFDSPPKLFFLWSAAATAVGLAILFGVLWLLRPHLASIHPLLVTGTTVAVATLAVLAWTWWALLGASYLLKRPLLPARLAERGLYLRLMSWTSRVASRFGRRDWVENASVKVYNALALIRQRKVNTGELLLLVPRCLSRDALDGVLAVAKRYAVPVFVATRGQLARRGHQGAPPPRRRRGGLRARHGERSPRCGGQGACAWPGSQAAIGTMQGHSTRSRAARRLGQGLRSLNSKGRLPIVVSGPNAYRSPHIVSGITVALDLPSGSVDILLLKALSWGPMHGFAISRWVRERSDDALALEDAALYQGLHRLQTPGRDRVRVGTVENNRRARYYRLTPTGTAPPA
jgi:hypothetical protein